MTMRPRNGRGGGRTALLVLGVVFHAVYVLSIFDIYFKSPVVAHIESLQYAAPASAAGSTTSSSAAPLMTPPAKRLVVFVADGCRADKFFEVNTTAAASSTSNSSNADNNNNNNNNERRVAFLRRVIETQGSWGVSHTRVPTESRPGHVALFAGMYEDVSAVTKGWQDNPVDFDSIFNQSRHAWLFGSPDIVPMFARTVPHAHEQHYSHEHEDFATDASELDVWVFDALAALLDRATTNATLAAELRAPQVLIFCHFLGIDTNGHAHRPNSRDYVDNIALVDELVEKTYRMVEDYYDYDGATAYVFSADHGMSNKGAHGDGDPANTRTPLVVWGAGVDGPQHVVRKKQDTKATAAETETQTQTQTNAQHQALSAFDIDLPTQSRAHVAAQLAAQQSQETAAAREWGSLVTLARKDVMQADVAPLISALLGLPYPRNSVGVLPFTYLARGAYRARAVLSNAQQLQRHAQRKEQEKEARTLLWFQPLRAFRDVAPTLLQQLDAFWRAQDLDAVERTSQELIAVCLDALEYLQRYDWFFLLSVIVAGYVGWIAVVAIAFLHPTQCSVTQLAPRDDAPVLALLLFSAVAYLALESSPLTYYLYVAFPIVFWRFAWRHRALLLPRRQSMTTATRWREAACVLLGLELVVLGYERRFIFGILFTLLGVWPLLDRSGDSDGSAGCFGGGASVRTRASWTASCIFISVFPYLPAEYGEHTALVVAGGVVLLALAATAAKALTSSRTSGRGRSATTIGGASSRIAWASAFVALGASLVTVHWTMGFLESKRKPPVALTLANWALAVVPIAALLGRLALRTGNSSSCASNDNDVDAEAHDVKLRALLLRMVEVVLACSPAYVLLSISYEVWFFLALCCVLASWIVVEAQLSAAHPLSPTSTSSTLSSTSSAASSTLWHEVRRAFFFLLLIKIAFFGTGNVASMSSFEISSTYRFVTVFAPFLMGALLVIKLLIPFLVVACAFHVVLELSQGSSTSGSSRGHDDDSAATAPSSRRRRDPPSRYFLLVVGMSDVLALHFLFLVRHEGSWKEIGNSISMFGIVNALIVFVPLLFVLAKAFVRDLLRRDDSDDDDDVDDDRKTQ